MRAGPIRAAKVLLGGTKSPPISELPAKAGTQTLSHRLKTARWPHACAKTMEENKAPYGPPGHFPQRGKITDGKSSPSGGSTGAAGVGGFFL